MAVSSENGGQVAERGTLVVAVDLKGATKCDPAFLTAEVVIVPPADWTYQRIREEAAKHYGVPVGQVDDPYPKTWADVDAEDAFHGH